LKLFFSSVHYARPLDLTDKHVEAILKRLSEVTYLVENINNLIIDNFTENRVPKSFSEIQNIRDKFFEAMDDDFSTEKALVAVEELIGLSKGKINNVDFIYSAQHALRQFFNIFALLPKEENVQRVVTLEQYIGLKNREREEARREKNYERADAIRKELEEKGIILGDAKSGKTTWRIEWGKVANNFEEQLKKDNENIELLLSLSVIYGEYIKNKAMAIDLCNTVIKLDPNNASARFGLALYTSHFKGNNKEVKDLYLEAENLMNQQGETQSERAGQLNIWVGHCFKELGAIEEAQRRYAKAIDILTPLALNSPRSAFWLNNAKDSLIELLKEVKKT
ncbi:MAG: hypothetical protein PHF11_07815, partial [Candidatus Omnitrophica bacterium]|nr:hypothetical protein [Candidatus Omnitrophota bacterium]